ncbi:hypothetical protein CLV30_108127 [Haloactinopolyspora alba]|uniref:Uncharacterized protein n=1 Tax=Haloactinopolyspora alba TaxID=648780 RepID=A0A2P8E175_9ACTN|nr:hypothetical protein [Haloactinopolyspora alba]PSL03215.1 hypothetical protein CLV30_108127 [Haloactinopolyspora alba]
MLRRDIEYVLTWNAAEHSWEARPIRRDGEWIIRLDPDADQVDAPPGLVDPTATGDDW